MIRSAHDVLLVDARTIVSLHRLGMPYLVQNIVSTPGGLLKHAQRAIRTRSS